LILLFLVATHIFIFLTVVSAHFIDPTLDLLNQPLDGSVVLRKAGNAYVTVLALCAIQFWIGLRFKNFIVPIAIGLALWLTGTLMVLEYHSSFANYFPYSFQIFPIFPKDKSGLNQVAWISVGYCILFLAGGFIEFRRRRMIG
jgi:hypothetical protein